MSLDLPCLIQPWYIHWCLEEETGISIATTTGSKGSNGVDEEEVKDLRKAEERHGKGSIVGLDNSRCDNA